MQPRIVARTRIAGGDINDAWRVVLEDGRTAFLKSRADPGPGEYANEAAGLRWLAAADALRVPEVLAVAEDRLVLEWVAPGRLDRAGEEELGRGLAVLHLAGAASFGALPPGSATPDVQRIGPVELPSRPTADWPGYYAECRLAPLLPHAGLSAAGRDAVERVCARLPELSGPREPPARLHGDLWAGNVHADSDGRPWLVDPAAYGGHREVDLAMLRLFGAPSTRTLDAYAEAAPLAPGHEDRVALWQLFPLLVHAVLFGGSYVAAAERTAARYA